MTVGRMEVNTDFARLDYSEKRYIGDNNVYAICLPASEACLANGLDGSIRMVCFRYRRREQTGFDIPDTWFVTNDHRGTLTLTGTGFTLAELGVYHDEKGYYVYTAEIDLTDYVGLTG